MMFLGCILMFFANYTLINPSKCSFIIDGVFIETNRDDLFLTTDASYIKNTNIRLSSNL